MPYCKRILYWEPNMARNWPDAEQRFWSHVNKTDECWMWTADKSKRYGRLLVNGKRVAAHVFSWTLHRGSASSMCVLHKCDVPKCVRPDHLFLGTQADNVADMIAKGRAWSVNKTHCIRGHPLSGDNLRRTKGGNSYHSQRVCRTCERAYQREWQQQKRNRLKAARSI